MTAYLRSLSINWNSNECEEYLSKIPALKNLTSLNLNAPLIIFTGENGTGKSTLLEALAVHCGFNAEGGSKNYAFSTKETHSSLYKQLQLIRNPLHPKDGFFLRAESFYNVATMMEEYDDDGNLKYSYGGKSLHQQSHGESFLALLQHRFYNQGLYFLDEPEAALSVQRQLTLLIILDELVKKGSQLILASHSPILLSHPQALIYSFDDNHIRPITYEETESFKIMRMFINHRETILRQLLNN